MTKRLTVDFQPFLGADARAVVAGLRDGTPITLSEAAPGRPPAARTVTINPPTRKMSHESVFLALSLAMRHLGRAGIFRPAPSELRAAFLGGSVTNRQGVTTYLQGVLTLRSQGMGWFRIAHLLGAGLDPAAGGAKAADRGSVPAWPTAGNLGGGIANGSGVAPQSGMAT